MSLLDRDGFDITFVSGIDGSGRAIGLSEDIAPGPDPNLDLVALTDPTYFSWEAGTHADLPLPGVEASASGVRFDGTVFGTSDGAAFVQTGSDVTFISHPGFENTYITTPVPEPMWFALLAMAGASIALRRR